MLDSAGPLQEQVLPVQRADALIREDERRSVPTDSTRRSHSTWRSNGQQESCKPLSRPTAWSDVKATVEQSPARICPISRKRGTRERQPVPPTIVVMPFQQNSPRLAVSVPRFGEHLELAGKQQFGFLVVE